MFDFSESKGATSEVQFGIFLEDASLREQWS